MSYQREIRAAQKRQRELARQAKERARLSELQAARLEVESFENQIDVLLSVHQEPVRLWDWERWRVALPPPVPRKLNFHSTRAVQNDRLGALLRPEARKTDQEDGQRQDEEKARAAERAYKQEMEEFQKFRALASRILAGDTTAYHAAIEAVDPLQELTSLGVQAEFRIVDAESLAVTLKVKDTQVVPTEAKSLTSTGKLSVRPMPKGRSHEIYQDYVCSCVLRVARETFALLPIDRIVITTLVRNPSAGGPGDLPVLSVVFDRERMERVDFEQVDPSDTVELFEYRGDFKSSRKTGTFQPVIPLVLAPMESRSGRSTSDFDALASAVVEKRNEIQQLLNELLPEEK